MTKKILDVLPCGISFGKCYGGYRERTVLTMVIAMSAALATGIQRATNIARQSLCGSSSERNPRSRRIACAIGLLSCLLVAPLTVQADPPPPPEIFAPGSTTLDCTTAGIGCGQGQTVPTISISPGASITEVNTWPAALPCSDGFGGILAGAATVTFTGSALYTGFAGQGGVYIPGAVSSTENPRIVSFPPASTQSTYHYTITTQSLPPAVAPRNTYILYSYGNIASTCPAGTSFPSAPAAVFSAEGPSTIAASIYYFLVPPDAAPPDLGPCDGSGSQSGCGQTPEPINPASGNEGLTGTCQ